MKNVLPLAILSMAILFSSNSFSQESTSTPAREIGIRMFNFQNFGLMYKKQLNDQKYRRWRLASTNIAVNTVQTIQLNLNGSVAFGYEKRKGINDKLYGYYGWEGILSTNYRAAPGFGNLDIRPALGFVMGLQYNVNQNFAIGLETIPSLSTNINYDSQIWRLTDINLGFNTNALSLNLLYRF